MSNVDVILSQAGEQETEYDWLRAVESYQKALGLVSEQDFLRLGGICERLGYAFYRVAMQAEHQEEFRDKMRQAGADYNRAKEFYGKIGEPRKTAKMLRCDAVAAFLTFSILH